MQPILFIEVTIIAVQFQNGQRKPLNENGLCPIHEIGGVNTISAVKYEGVPNMVKTAISIPGRVWLVSETIEEIREKIRKEQMEWALLVSNTAD